MTVLAVVPADPAATGRKDPHVIECRNQATVMFTSKAYSSKHAAMKARERMIKYLARHPEVQAEVFVALREGA